MKARKEIPPTHKRNPHFPDRHIYPPGEDLYNQFKKEADIDPEDVGRTKAFIEIEKPAQKNQNDYREQGDDDLDIPGAELDDGQEQLGSEDEENNGYSLGGDNHQDLEEQKD